MLIKKKSVIKIRIKKEFALKMYKYWGSKIIIYVYIRCKTKKNSNGKIRLNKNISDFTQVNSTIR